MFQISDEYALRGSTGSRMYDAVILHSEMLSPALKQVTFKAAFPYQLYLPGQEIWLCLPDNDHLPVPFASFNRENDICSLLFHVTGKNPHTGFVTQLQKGDTLRYRLEKGKILYDEQATHHFFFGDESALGLFNAYKEFALQNDHEYFGVLELEQQNEHVLAALKLLVDCVPPCTTPAQYAIHWMEDMHPHCWMAWQKASFYLAGSSQAVERFRDYLLKKKVSRTKIFIAGSSF